MLKKQTVDDRWRPGKSWGWEEWIVNNALYCGKRLHFTKVNVPTSLHFHKNKHETMYVERGQFVITVVDTRTAEPTDYTLNEGESLVIEPMTAHRIVCRGRANAESGILVEFSTHHEDDDSYRVAK
jgi:mannose-6-phosphate isomerase-like protein (cupin superfamily)